MSRAAPRLCYRRPVNDAAVLLLSLAALGCTRVEGAADRAPAAKPAPSSPSAPARASAAAASAEPCTLATPLVPGVPGSPGHLIRSDRNPNGASELAELMRAMQRELRAAGEAIQKGASRPPLHGRFQKIRCAWPTQPEDRNATFDGFAVSYLRAVTALDAASPAEARRAYDGVLSACRACHEQSCSGAIPAIDALRLPPPR